MKAGMIASLVLCFVAAGCYYDNEEQLYNCSVDPATNKYAASITALFTSYGCTGCHSGATPLGGINLGSYAGTKVVVDNAKLYGAISHLPGFAPMPQGGSKMSDCDIKKVKAWIDAGAPNN